MLLLLVAVPLVSLKNVQQAPCNLVAPPPTLPLPVPNDSKPKCAEAATAGAHVPGAPCPALFLAKEKAAPSRAHGDHESACKEKKKDRGAERGGGGNLVGRSRCFLDLRNKDARDGAGMEPTTSEEAGRFRLIC